jgi:hypothetical protein
MEPDQRMVKNDLDNLFAVQYSECNNVDGQNVRMTGGECDSLVVVVVDL